MAENKTEVIVVTKFEKSTTTPKRRAIEASDGRIFSYFHGDDGAPEWESLIRIDGAIEVTYFDKPNAKYPQHPYHNVVEVKAAEMPKEVPAATPGGNGHEDSGPSPKDISIARCNATNNAAALAAVYQQMDIPWDFWAMTLQIEQYILTGVHPPVHDAVPPLPPEFLDGGPVAKATKPPPALLAECATYVREMQAYGVRNVVMPPPGTTEIEVAEFAAGLRSRLAELKKNVDLGEEKQ